MMEDEVHTAADVQQQIDAFCAAGDCAMAAAYGLEALKVRLRGDLVPRFWEAVSSSGDDGIGSNLGPVLASSLEGFCTAVAGQQQQAEALEEQLLAALPQEAAAAPAVACLQDRYRKAVTTRLLSAAPVDLHSLLTLVLDAQLSEFAEASPVQLGSQEDDEEKQQPQSGTHITDVMGAGWLDPLASIGASLEALDLRYLLDEAALGVACGHVQRALATHAGGEFHSSVLADAARYVEAVPLHFLHAVLHPQDAKSPQQWAQHLQYYIFETVGRLRIGEMFDIVVDYPDSLPAVHDVRDCLAHASLQQHFVSRFRAAIRKRLLHAGAATTDIIVQYVSTIKTLREVDASGVLLEAVADPIREYLRSRKDTIRSIVTMMTDDSPSDVPGSESLFQELNRTDQGPEDVSDAEMDDDEAALAAAEAWEPDPVTADPLRSSRTRRMSDVIAALVGIYGSNELFITEYRLMLADRLAGKSDFDCQRELRTMELLKLRFGESNMHNAEIMLGDVASSKRINAAVHDVKPELTKYKTTIVSELFWPPFQGEPVQLPPQVSAALEAFSAEYHNLKAPRKLQYKPFLGSVQLVITAGGEQRDMRVTPLQAAVILQFKDQPSWPLQALADAMKLTPSAVRKTVIFWTSQGILREVAQPGGGQAVERVEDMQSAPTASGDADEEPVSSVISAEEQQAQDTARIDQCIIMMLSNFDGMPADRIHNMLKMFVQEPQPYDRSEEQLATMLSRLVAQNRLSVSGGMYRIVHLD